MSLEDRILLDTCKTNDDSEQHEVDVQQADKELHDYLDDEETLYSKNKSNACVSTEDGSFQHR